MLTEPNGNGYSSHERPNNIQIEETKETSEVQPLLAQIIELADHIVKQIDAKYEPDLAIKELNKYLDLQCQQIWEVISANNETKVNFYNKVFKAVAEKMLNEKMIQGVGVSNKYLI